MIDFKFLFKSIIIIFPQLLISQQIEFSEWELVADNQKFPEGITWDFNGNLYSSNCYGNWITRISESKIDTFLLASDSTFSKTNGMIAFKDGSILACDFGRGSIIKFSLNGAKETIIDGFEGIPLNRPNDLTFDENGNLYFTDPKSYASDILDGRVFYYNFSTQNLIIVKDSLAFPNGIAVSPTSKHLYVCESAKSRILSFKINRDNSLSEMNVFINLPGGDPDGINFDVNGNLYVAHFGSGNLYIISPEGKILHQIKTPGKKPSNIEFAGPDLKTLYLTEDESNSIFKMTLSVEGHSFK